MYKNNNEKVFPVYKSIGETPYSLVQKFRIKKNTPKELKVAYAGRLDPMAEGIVLLIVGEKLTNFNNYLQLKKEYEADILFGFTTDTYDILGLPTRKKQIKINYAEIGKQIINQDKIFSFSLPPFSSYKIKGKPLFSWARENRLNEIKIPTKEIKINDLKIINHYMMSEEEIKKIVVGKLKKVRGDFRQKRIQEEWNNLLKKKEEKHIIFRIKIATDSGFYVRSFADKIGKDLSVGAILFDLKRIKIDKYNINDCIKL